MKLTAFHSLVLVFDCQCEPCSSRQGHPKYNGMMVLTKPETTHSLDECKINCMPANLEITFKVVDLPHHGSSIVVGTGQEPMKIFH